MSAENTSGIFVYDSEIQGVEYDWIAIDVEGALACFSTVGEGFVPASFIESVGEHDGALDKIFDSPILSEALAYPSVQAGVRNVWKDLADRGVYAYDFDLVSRSYKLVGRPGVIVNVGQIVPGLAIEGLLRLPLCFRASDSIALSDLQRL